MKSLISGTQNRLCCVQLRRQDSMFLMKDQDKPQKELKEIERAMQ